MTNSTRASALLAPTLRHKRGADYEVKARMGHHVDPIHRALHMDEFVPPPLEVSAHQAPRIAVAVNYRETPPTLSRTSETALV